MRSTDSLIANDSVVPVLNLNTRKAIATHKATSIYETVFWISSHNTWNDPALHKQSFNVALPERDRELGGHRVHVPSPAATLYVFAWHA